MEFITIPTTDAIRDIVRMEITSALQEHRTLIKNQKTYLTRQQVANKMSVSLPTIHSYVNRGILISYKVEGRTLFKANEVEEAIKRNRR